MSGVVPIVRHLTLRLSVRLFLALLASLPSVSGALAQEGSPASRPASRPGSDAPTPTPESQPEVIGHLEPGSHPAGRIVEALRFIEPRPIIVDDTRLLSRNVVLFTELTVTRDSRDSLVVLLKSVGLHLHEITVDAQGRRALVVDDDPSGRAHVRPHYKIALIDLKYRTADEVAPALQEYADTVEAALPEEAVRTRFIASPRTGQLVVRFASDERFQRYVERLKQVDRPRERTGPVLRSYICRARVAEAVRTEFEDAWKEEGRPLPHIVTHASSNSLLFRIPEQHWEPAKAILERLDRRR